MKPNPISNDVYHYTITTMKRGYVPNLKKKASSEPNHQQQPTRMSTQASSASSTQDQDLAVVHTEIVSQGSNDKSQDASRRQEKSSQNPKSSTGSSALHDDDVVVTEMGSIEQKRQKRFHEFEKFSSPHKRNSTFSPLPSEEELEMDRMCENIKWFVDAFAMKDWTTFLCAEVFKERIENRVCVLAHQFLGSSREGNVVFRVNVCLYTPKKSENSVKEIEPLETRNAWKDVNIAPAGEDEIYVGFEVFDILNRVTERSERTLMVGIVPCKLTAESLSNHRLLPWEQWKHVLWSSPMARAMNMGFEIV